MAGLQSAYPKALEALIQSLRRLPGIGRRTAERLAMALLEWRPDELQRFGGEIARLREDVRFCRLCGNLADGETCRICSAPARDRTRICVVEQAAQIPVIESSGAYRGLYHVLGGRLSPLEGRGPADLRIRELHERVRDGQIGELIVATSSDLEGEATAHYLAGEFGAQVGAVTRIAAGVPVGADLSYADAATVAMAMSGRRVLKGGESS